MTTLLAPQRREMSTAAAAPVRSMSFLEAIRALPRIRHLA
jgi:hypothetical protein